MKPHKPHIYCLGNLFRPCSRCGRHPTGDTPCGVTVRVVRRSEAYDVGSPGYHEGVTAYDRDGAIVAHYSGPGTSGRGGGWGVRMAPPMRWRVGMQAIIDHPHQVEAWDED